VPDLTCAIGVDVGGTKIAAGLVLVPEGRVLARRVQPTKPARGGEAVLADVIELVQALREEARRQGVNPVALGVGVAELVDRDGNVASEATIRWQGLPVRSRLQELLPTRLDADVRVAALAEARVGAGRSLRSFLYLTIGTGISSCLVIDGSPWPGERGIAGTCASSLCLFPGPDGRLVHGPPIEQYSSGPALVSRLAQLRPGFSGSAHEVLSLAEQGDRETVAVVDSAARAVGALLAHLVSVLDPAAAIIGGGLGLAGGRYRAELERTCRELVWSKSHREVPLLSAQLGADAGFIGAALAAASNERSA
jgi:glucokinase